MWSLHPGHLTWMSIFLFIMGDQADWCKPFGGDTEQGYPWTDDNSLTKAVQAPRPKSPPLFLPLEIPNRDVSNDNGLTLESWGRQGQKFSLSAATKDQFYPCSQLINSQTQGDLKQDNVTCWVTLSPSWQQSISQSRQKPERIKVHLQKHWVSKVPHHRIP